MQNAQSKKTVKPRRRGSALVSAMSVILITMVIVGSLSAFVASGVFRVRLLTDRIRAKAIAEAGINRAYSTLRTNWNLRTISTLYNEIPFGDGFYTVTLAPRTNDNAGRIVMTSLGHFGRADHRVGTTLRDTYYLWFLDYTLFSNGDTDFNGVPEIDGGIQCNGGFYVPPGGGWAGITSNSVVSGQNWQDFPVEFQHGWRLVPFPALDDPVFQEYLAEADAAGMLNIIEGDLLVKKETNFVGITIIKGDLTLQVPKSQTATVNGMLYVTGNVLQNGQGELQFTGTLMAGGNIRFNGAAGVFDYDRIDASTNNRVNIVIDGWWN